MELTHEIIDMTYRFAHTYLKRCGRTDIETQDLSHDAMVRIAKATPPPPNFIRRKVWLDVQCCFLDLYTNRTKSKHNILLDAVHADFDMVTHDPDTVDVADEFGWALKIVRQGHPTQYEIMMLILQGKTIKEIAQMRGTTTNAVDELKQKARKNLAAILMCNTN